MMKKVSFSNDNLTIGEIWDWYGTNKEAELHYNNLISNSVISPQVIPMKFIGMTFTELETYFEDYEHELDLITSFNLLSAAEATLRIDFNERVYNREKDDLSRIYRDLYKTKGNKISLEDDIIQNWKEKYPQFNKFFSDFIGALGLRHWLAHGRYWIPKLGRNYDAYTVYTIVDSIISIVNN